MAEEKDKTRKTKIFISYSRKNKPFVYKLVEALEAADIDVWVDWEGIPLSADWMAEITAAIEGADAFIFVISPDSVKSKVCGDELELGIQNNKKIIPVLFDELQNDEKLHPKLASTNWVYLRPEKDDFDVTMPKLVEAIQTDLGWVQRHTRILQRAVEWEQKQRNHSYLLQGADLEEDERWMAQASKEAGRQVTALQAEYIHASRKAAMQRQRYFMIGVSIALLISLVLAGVAVRYAQIANENKVEADNQKAIAVANASIARENEKKAMANKRQAEINARRALQKEGEAKAQRNASNAKIYQDKPGELEASTLFAVNAYTQLNLPDAEEILRDNISLLAILIAYPNVEAPVLKIQVNHDRTKFVTADAGGKACVWNMQDGAKYFCTHQDGMVYDSVFSLDGNILATASSKGLVIFWDANTGEQKKAFHYNGIVWDLSVHPNGRWLGISRTDGISLIDMTTMKENMIYTLSGEVNKIDFDSSGRYMAFALSDGNVSIWQINTQRTIAGPRHTNQSLHVVFSPNGSWLLSTGADSTARVKIVQDDSPQKYSVVEGDRVEYGVFTPDSSRFVTAADDGFVRVFNTFSGQELMRMSHGRPVMRVRVSPDDQWIVSIGYDQTARIWDAFSGAEMMRLPIEGVGSTIEINSDATRLVTGDRSGNVMLWDISQLRDRQNVLQFSRYARKVHFSPDGKWLVANADDKNVWLVSFDQSVKKTENLKVFLTVKGFTSDIVVSPDSNWIAAIEYDPDIGDYNRVVLKSVVGDQKAILSYENKTVIKAAIFTPDSRKIITVDEQGLVYFWDVKSGTRFPGELKVEGDVRSLAIDPHGKYLVTGLSENRALVWDFATLSKIKVLEQLGIINETQFSNDGKWLATGSSEETAYLWNVADQSFTRAEDGTFQSGGAVSAIQFNPANNLLAVGSANGQVRLFDLNLRQEVARLRHISDVTGISFSPDGKLLATVSQKNIYLWNFKSIQFFTRDQLVKAACSRLIHNFSTSKWELLFPGEKYRPICSNLPSAGEK